MSLHQIWPRNEEPSKESLSPLQVSLEKDKTNLKSV